jgi:hypothetical protein
MVMIIIGTGRGTAKNSKLRKCHSRTSGLCYRSRFAKRVLSIIPQGVPHMWCLRTLLPPCLARCDEKEQVANTNRCRGVKAGRAGRVTWPSRPAASPARPPRRPRRPASLPQQLYAMSVRILFGVTEDVVLRSAVPGEGILCTASATGTLPVFDICSSSCSCCSASSSSSSSISSIGSPTVCPVMALTISSLRAFSSRNLSLQSEQLG